MFSVHYATQLNFTFDGLNASRKARLRIQNYIYELFQNQNKQGKNPDAKELEKDVFSALANDLQTPKALASIFDFINENPANELSQDTAQKLIKFFEKFNKIFNVWEISPRKEEEIQIPQEVEELARLRWQAKQKKDFRTADEIREKIKSLGFQVIDTKEGYKIEPLSK
jgi:cysteinyl-tRNA synthetase